MHLQTKIEDRIHDLGIFFPFQITKEPSCEFKSGDEKQVDSENRGGSIQKSIFCNYLQKLPSPQLGSLVLIGAKGSAKIRETLKIQHRVSTAV